MVIFDLGRLKVNNLLDKSEEEDNSLSEVQPSEGRNSDGEIDELEGKLV